MKLVVKREKIILKFHNGLVFVLMYYIFNKKKSKLKISEVEENKTKAWKSSGLLL